MDKVISILQRKLAYDSDNLSKFKSDLFKSTDFCKEIRSCLYNIYILEKRCSFYKIVLDRINEEENCVVYLKNLLYIYKKELEHTSVYSLLCSTDPLYNITRVWDYDNISYFIEVIEHLLNKLGTHLST